MTHRREGAAASTNSAMAGNTRRPRRRRLPALTLALAAAASLPLAGAFQSHRTAITSRPPCAAARPMRPTTRLSEAAAASSAASEWMANEKKLEEEMDGDAAGAEATPAQQPPTAAGTNVDLGDEGEEDLPPVGGRWESLHGNYILRPPPGQQPRALIHFLGGALVGAAPQLTYRYLLERLSSRGYLVVATPYQLSFDHLATCDEVIGRFELVAPDLAKQYGAVPVVGVGHSCGALLHMLITSLFPDTPRAANALISYNNREVSGAVPFFEEVFVPLFSDKDRNGSELMKALIAVGREEFSGKVPSDESLLRLFQSIPVPGIPGLMETIVSPSLVTIPTPVRQSLTNFLTEPAYQALSDVAGTNIPSLLLQSLDVTQQIPKLIDEVEGGARDFVPTPDAMSSAARRAYRCRRTLLLQFSDDALDDSEQLEGYLKEAESVMKMKRPMITIDLRRRVLEGSHLTPLLGPSGGEGWGEALEEALGGVLGKVDGVKGNGGEEDGAERDATKAVRETLGYEQVERVVDELAAWLDEGSL
ncbi:hypothetical protein ACHAXT_011355 [Thalassiosira profunda]